MALRAQVDLLLIERLLRYVCGIKPYSGNRGSEPGAVKGAVLVFLPVRPLMLTLPARHNAGNHTPSIPRDAVIVSDKEMGTAVDVVKVTRRLWTRANDGQWQNSMPQ